jgi:hypothetical protein
MCCSSGCVGFFQPDQLDAPGLTAGGKSEIER